MLSLLAFASFPLFFALLNGGSCERLICDRFLPCRYKWEDVGTVSDEDLMQVSSELLRKDVGNAAKDIRLRYQARVLSKDLNDEAPKPLMKLNANVFKLPNVAKMKMIFDNFNPYSGESENVTSEHREEQVDLMSSIYFTSVMQTALDFLANNAIITSNKQFYFDLLMEMWFLMFPRTTQDNRGSCAFESIFLAELVHGKILGMNNWIFFSSQEAKKNADYMGYKKIVNLGERGAIVKLRYKWLDVVNPSGYMFVGTSPEFEMALYTICFLSRPNRPCHLSLEGQNVTIRTQSVSFDNETYLGRVSFSI